MPTTEDDNTPLLNKRGKPRKSSAPPIEDDTQGATKREVNKARVVSLQQCAIMLGYDRNTVEKWVKFEDCPYITKADRDRGVAWELDLAAVVRWLQDRAVRNATGGGDEDGDGKPTAAKKRKEDAQAIVAELEAADMLRMVVPLQPVLDRIERDYNEIKKRLMTLSAAIAGRMDASIQRVVKEIADEQVRAMLAKLKVEDVIKAAQAPSSEDTDED
ncbi:terminase small subunit [Rhizobium sp. Root149]|uniref:terminase small subunit n=1 Tax=Rhizobium sp. Root149 TaxID=1736473 RepID=UPI000B2D5C94|nr:terminase small subunit [Rhizobium sp. Root149]